MQNILLKCSEEEKLLLLSFNCRYCEILLNRIVNILVQDIIFFDDFSTMYLHHNDLCLRLTKDLSAQISSKKKTLQWTRIPSLTKTGRNWLYLDFFVSDISYCIVWVFPGHDFFSMLSILFLNKN